MSAGRLTLRTLGALWVAAGALLFSSVPALATAGGEFVLPDGRQYELVSPPDTQGAVIEPISQGVLQASEDGGAITYLAEAPLGADPVGNPLFTQVLSSRGADGAWASQDISTPHEVASGLRIGEGQEYRFASPSLSLALVEPFGETPLSSLASERTLYLRDDPPIAPDASERATYDGVSEEAGQGRAFPPGYLPLVTEGNVPPGTHLGAHSAITLGLEFVDATPDLSHVIFRSEEALTPNAIRNVYRPENESLYEWIGGQLQLVSVLPDGRPATEPEAGEAEASFATKLGDQNENVRHAVSDDGSRVVWQAPFNTGGHLYMRDMTSKETIQLDTPELGAGSGLVHPRFQAANDTTVKIFFTDTQQLTAGSAAEESTEGGHEGDLYECEVTEVAGRPACNLKDLTVDPVPGQNAHVLGTAPGVSEEGSYVYFVAEGVLAAGATNEADNLYVAHEEGGVWRTTFISTLQSEDASDWALTNLNHMTSRVSSNGRYLAFMSHGSLTGYDNHDANSDEPDTEVYLYDASTPRLICASCNPTGERPVGMLDVAEKPLVDRSEASAGQWLAGSIPGWTPMAGVEGIALYQSRYLSDEGRLFFDSSDALVPQDTNGKEDVYEYEPEGIGGCKGSSETFSDKSDGCVALISSGTSGEESAFLDASMSGDDVFFLTSAKLVPGDSDTGYHVYDAHVCGADGVACATTTVSSPPCTTADSCRQAPSPQPGIFGAPSSATFSGAGDLPAPASKPAVTPKVLTRAQRLANALKTCRKRPKKKRAACESQARKKFKSTKSKAREASS